MNRFVFSPSESRFYAIEWQADYVDNNCWPHDAINVSDSIYYEFSGTPPTGKQLITLNNMPSWGDIPPPTREELIVTADVEKQKRIDLANDYMNGKQWPGKAAIGRLKGEELAQYNLWLDYLDALELVDTASAPDIGWPTPPAVQAR
ncbi:tail fiber assembly protein [Escherichia coli]|nr:tail fiber assembly protein [Escherichia coli]